MTNYYPNLTWPQFTVCNDDTTGAFEDMARRLFCREFLDEGTVPHSEHNNPGVEVVPVFESIQEEGSKRRKISFQAKYFENNINYFQIKESMKQAIKHYSGNLDLIYLFCNKTLTTTTKGYKAIKALLEDSGIELYPISNKEILDLVSKYKDIANYFFFPRKRPGDGQIGQIYAEMVVNTDGDNICASCQNNAKNEGIDPAFFRDFIQEKIVVCKSLLLELSLNKLREELDKVSGYNIIGMEGTEKLLFYKSILDIHDGKEFDVLADGLTEQHKVELAWLGQFYKTPGPVSSYTYASHCIESQVMVLDKLFTAGLWEEIVLLCEEIIDDSSVEISDTIKQYYGLALFNLQNYSLASSVLKELDQKNHKEDIFLYSILAEIKAINHHWQDGACANREHLIELVHQLESLKNNTQYKSNIRIVAMLHLESAYNLGADEKNYLENGIEIYQSYDEEIKNDTGIKYLYALCLEMNGDIESAEKVYAEFDWKDDENIACRYLLCKLSRSEYAEAIKLYREINHTICNSKLKSLYLAALFYDGSDLYEDTLNLFISNAQDDFGEIIDIAFGVSEKKYLQKYIIPLVKAHLNAELDKLNLLQKTELLSILSNAGEIELILVVIKSVTEIDKLNRVAVKEIYDVTFDVSNREFLHHDIAMVQSSQLEMSEKIANIFLEADIYRREFLQIKYLCAGAKGQSFSMLKYAKELFEITHEEGLARNIIAMLFDRRETDVNAYTPYLSALSNTTNPDYCMAMASAMLRLGKNEEADLYAYKSLYYLNDLEDYEIYKGYFGYYHQNQNRYQGDCKLQCVKGNSVVTLEKNSQGDEQAPTMITLCLDSESEFSDVHNISMGVRHVPASSSLYLKILGSGMQQVLKIDGINYKIVDIRSRIDYAAGFIYGKIKSHPEKFNGTVFVLTAEKPEELIGKIKSMTDRSERIETQLSLYHFKENEIGIPIDAFTNGEYDHYLDALTMLLYAKDQALYTGLPIYENEENQKYVPTLSTLALLSTMNLMHVLSPISNNILIPESYLDFFNERYRRAKELSYSSQGRLVNVNNQLALIPNDSSQIDIWERIVDFCMKCNNVRISDEERIGFSIGEDINGEQFISVAQLHSIHLDSFILAKKEQATLLCDDLFFRKLATYGQIRNLNFASLLRHYEDNDFVVPIIIELSKTNYLYIPIIARTDDELTELEKNLLQGELKQKYYSDMLTMHHNMRQKIIREIMGEDIEFEEEE